MFGFVLEVFVCVVGAREFSVFGTLFTQFVSCFVSSSSLFMHSFGFVDLFFFV